MWAANEFTNTEATANWGAAIANFSPTAAAITADLSVTVAGPSSVTASTNATYTITLTNTGPGATADPVLRDTLPAGAVFQGGVRGGCGNDLPQGRGTPGVRTTSSFPPLRRKRTHSHRAPNGRPDSSPR